MRNLITASLLALWGACGPPEPQLDPNSGAAGGTSPNGGGGAGQGAGGTGGAGGSLLEPDCSLPLQEPRVALEKNGSNLVQSSAVTGDELELFYVELDGDFDGGTDGRVMRTERADRNAVFPTGQVVAELVGLCGYGEVNFDLTPDGLRFYLVCEGEDDIFHTVELFERKDRSSFFISRGLVGISTNSLAVSEDELSLISHTNVADEPSFQVYDRQNLEGSFAYRGDLLVQNVSNSAVRGAALSPDGNILFFSKSEVGAPQTSLWRSSKVDVDVFSEPTRIDFEIQFAQAGSAEVGPACHNLYFTGDDAAEAGTGFRIYQSHFGPE